jgi:hypothetical protein
LHFRPNFHCASEVKGALNHAISVMQQFKMSENSSGSIRKESFPLKLSMHINISSSLWFSADVVSANMHFVVNVSFLLNECSYLCN